MRFEAEIGRNQNRGQIKNVGMFWSVVPETTAKTVVSGAHTGVVLAHVPETTIKIVVSGPHEQDDDQRSRGERRSKSR